MLLNRGINFYFFVIVSFFVVVFSLFRGKKKNSLKEIEEEIEKEQRNDEKS